MFLQRSSRDERGFTLVEVMITIIIMGIVLSIATSSWFGVARSRNVDSATNQVAADLRLAHSQATNRLADYSFVAPAVTVPSGVDPLSTYEIGPTGGTHVVKRLPKGSQLSTATEIKFKADGSAQVMSGANPITIRSSVEHTNDHTIGINISTSRVQVVP